jgi:phosphate-selective porin
VFRGGAGAWEAAVRLEALTFGELGAGGSSSPRAATVLGNGDRALTLGLNWYLSPNLKMQTNVIRDALSDPSRGPVPAQPSYWSSVVRLQVAM